MRRLLALSALLFSAACVPTGDVPPYEPVVTPDADVGPDRADAAPDAAPDAALDMTPDMRPDMAPDPCADPDEDGYVVAEGCPLPAGDCAPMDAERNPGVAERCNRLDDDCDGISDEGDPQGGDDCETGEPGICNPGQTTCAQGEVVCEQLERRALDELCNGRDDDCDGQTDEAVPTLGQPCDTEQPGVCGRGASACVQGDVVCQAEVEAGPEQCNNLDDDCDGQTDEEDPGGGGACDTGLDGVCAVGVEACTGGEIACAATAEPGPETCNRLDDDCDGLTDETFPTLGDACTVGEGACERESVFVCAGDGERVVCDATAGDGTPERCNGEDDDCDGQIDEGFALGEACTNGVGQCERPGQTVCAGDASGVTCDAVPGEAFDETCNALDDDCDGAVDEAFPMLGMGCVDEAGQCPSPGTLVCAEDGEGVACDAEPVLPTPELCNGADDDCDGQADEDFAELGEACAVGVGACERSGAVVCDAEGGTTCDVEPGEPGAELCDGQDNDCDGRIDNQAPCLGPPTGAVVAARVAEFDEAVCPDLDGDGVADNGLGALAGRLNPRLRARLEAGQGRQLVRAPGLTTPPFALEVLDAVESEAGPLVPAAGALDGTGRGRQRLTGLELADGALSGGDPAVISVASPLFWTDAADPLGLARLGLAPAVARGPLSRGPEGGLQSAGLVLAGAIDRGILLTQAADLDARCGEPEPPAECAGRVTADEMAANLAADLDRDRVSVCLVLQLEPALDPASSPPRGPIPCAADGDCFAGLVCRAVPWVADGAPGAALAQRCGPPGVGGGRAGEPCATHDDCRGGLCVAATAAGGRCTALCEADVDCPADHACRGVPVDEVDGAFDRGGRSARACVPVTGSGAPCAQGCPDGEGCTPWLGGEVGVAGGQVGLAPTCEALDPGGAALGAPCADALDCARGLGCAPDLEGALRCAPLCAGPDDCDGGTICADWTVADGVGLSPALVVGACQPVPAELGTGRPCAADVDCAPHETCAARWLTSGEAHSRFCAATEGFFTVGQPCAEDADCASGACVAGWCGGGCRAAEDCGPAQGCAADTWLDAEGRPISAGCGPAITACIRDRDCTDDDPLCADGACVCDGGTCRRGCRHPGACADGQYCRPDDVCGAFCRDDAEEPNDVVADATRLPLGRAEPTLTRAAELCQGSPVDWYQFSTGGQPFTATLTPPRRDDVRVELGLFDANGALIAPAQVDPDTGRQTVALDAEAAADRLGQNLALRVRAAGRFEQLAYQLQVALDVPPCPDPLPEPFDNPWQWAELLGDRPGAQAELDLTGRICPQDVDWYGVYVGNGDTLTVSVTATGNGGADPANEAIEVALIGPDFPDLPSARVLLAVPTDGTPVQFTPPNMFCDVDQMCAFADGTQSAVFCAQEAEQCRGTGYYLRLRGAGPFDHSGYDLNVRVDRADAAQACVPDLFEHDDNFQFLDRVHAAMGPASVARVGENRTLPMGTQLNINTLRACGGEGPQAEAADGDNFMFYLEQGDRVIALLTQVNAPELMQLDTYRVDANGIERLSAAPSQDRQILAQVGADVPGYYAVGVLRAGRGEQVQYSPSLPYTLSMVRLPIDFVPDTACEEPQRLALRDNVAEVTGTTLGGNDDHRPLDCLGGTGPDRVFVLNVPPGDGVLRATVVDNSDARYDPAVSIRTDCAVPNSELACNEDDAGSLDPFAQARAQAVVNGGPNGRDVFVVVDSHDPDTAGRFRLLLRYIPGEQCDLQTGECDDPCDDINCPPGLRCDPDDGACVECVFDGQCAGEERCLDRACVAGANRQVSDWGADSQDPPNCVDNTQCTPDERCTDVPFAPSDYCLMPCGVDLACPEGFTCCSPPPGTLADFCSPANQPLLGLCE